MLALAALASLVVQLSPAQRARVAWVPNPRTANASWVSDPSHHLRPATIAEINGIIGALERETTSEIGVAVVDSTSGLEPQEFATALHRVWGVGKAGRNNGVLLLWDPVHRAVFISVGYGLEGALPDRRAGRIRDDIIAEFRQNRFDEGIVTGVREIAAAAREETGAQPAGLSGEPGATRSSGPGGWIAGILGSIVASVGGAFGIRRWRRRRPRNCSHGHPMRLLSESADDAMLDEASRLEEDLKSVDWDVWVCDACGEVERIARRAWFTSYGECTRCHRRTVKKKVTVITRPTYSSSGLKRITRTCRNCGLVTEHDETIPRLEHSSSSSSGGGGGGGGGGGSFGGGSAGGGGAGGHY